MNKFTAAFSIGIILFGASTASALTFDDVQAQIQTLLARITELTTQLNMLRGTAIVQPVDPMVAVPPSQHRICGVLNRNLTPGAQGDDVRSLQEYLYEQKILTVAPTGYFGPMTVEAVRKWQAREGVTAAGAFGPMSREKLKMWCGGGVVNTEQFSASPTQGTAPLAVSFSTWISGMRVPGTTFSIDFGDGFSEAPA